MNLLKWSQWKIIFSIVLVLILLYSVGVTSLLSAIQLIPLTVFILLILIALLTLAFNIIAVWSLYRVVSPISLSEFTPAFLSSWAAGFFLPGKVGSLSLTVILKPRVKPGVSAAIFVIDKIITIILALSLGAFFLQGIIAESVWWTIISITVCVLAISSATVLTNTGRSFVRKLLGKHSMFFEGFSNSLPLFLARPQGVIINIALTLARSGIQALSFVYLFSSFQLSVEWWDMIAFSASENLASLVPVTISGIGLREVVVATLSTQIGIPFSTGVAAGLIMTAVTIMVVIPAIFAFDEKRFFRTIQK